MIPTLVLIAMLTGHPYTALEERYAAAIDTATQDQRMRVVLLVVAHQETRMELHSPTPPFGLDDWSAVHGRWPSIEEGAQIAPKVLAFLSANRCPRTPLVIVLGRYNLGHDCRSTSTSRVEVCRINALLVGRYEAARACGRQVRHRHLCRRHHGP